MPRSSLLPNAPAPLDLPTYDGSGQCVHPDVLAIHGRRYPARYLMAMEPYPYSDSTFENPSLLCSDDGLHWGVPPGTTNPVVAPPQDPKAWHSDGDLLLREDGQLSLYYRFNSGRGETTLCRMTLAPDGRWSPAEALFTEPLSGRFASPALVDGEAGPRMFWVDTLAKAVHAGTSSDGRRWDRGAALLEFPGAWHVDALVHEGWWYLLLNAADQLYLLRSDDLARWWILGSDPGEPAWVRWDRDGPADADRFAVLRPSALGWDDQRIYRSTFLFEDGRLRVWYSAKSRENEWRIGYTDALVPA